MVSWLLLPSQCIHKAACVTSKMRVRGLAIGIENGALVSRPRKEQLFRLRAITIHTKRTYEDNDSS